MPWLNDDDDDIVDDDDVQIGPEVTLMYLLLKVLSLQ